MPGPPWLTNNDRWFFLQMYQWFPSILKVVRIIQPETLVCWHRAGFRCYWRWKSRRRGGRPQIEADLRTLIRRMSVENPLWGAPRIHGELLKLGFAVAQSSVAKYMVKRRGPPSQGWRTFLHNHAPDIAAMGPVCCPDHRLRPAICLHHRAARSPRPRLDQRHDKPHRRMDRAPANRCISLGRSSALPHPRSGSNLWRYRHTPITRHGHPGQEQYEPTGGSLDWPRERGGELTLVQRSRRPLSLVTSSTLDRLPTRVGRAEKVRSQFLSLRQQNHITY